MSYFKAKMQKFDFAGFKEPTYNKSEGREREGMRGIEKGYGGVGRMGVAHALLSGRLKSFTALFCDFCFFYMKSERIKQVFN